MIKLQETQVFFWEFCEIFKNTLFIEHLRPTASDECIWQFLMYLLKERKMMKDS